MKEKWYMTWWIIATLSAYIVKGLCGFGGTLVFSTILSYNLNKVNISPVDLVLGYISNIVMAWHDRNRINRRCASDFVLFFLLVFFRVFFSLNLSIPG